MWTTCQYLSLTAVAAATPTPIHHGAAQSYWHPNPIVYPTPYGLWMPAIDSMARIDLRMRQQIDLRLTPDAASMPAANAASQPATTPATMPLTIATGAIATARATSGARRLTGEQVQTPPDISARPDRPPLTMVDEGYRQARLHQISARLKARLASPSQG